VCHWPELYVVCLLGRLWSQHRQLCFIIQAVYQIFEVASFSRCRNIKREPPNFGELSQTRVTPTFPLGVILWWALANARGMKNLKSLAPAVAEILKGNPQILGNSPSPGPHLLFFWWDLMMSLQTPAVWQIWSRWLHLLRKFAFRAMLWGSCGVTDGHRPQPLLVSGN